MNKVLKITMVVAILVAMLFISTSVFANGKMIDPSKINATYDSTASSSLVTIAGKVIGLIRNIAVIAGVILLTWIGLKFMLGSAEEKAKYKESLMPLIIGIIVVMSATQIATMIFGFFD